MYYHDYIFLARLYKVQKELMLYPRRRSRRRRRRCRRRRCPWRKQC